MFNNIKDVFGFISKKDPEPAEYLQHILNKLDDLLFKSKYSRRW